MSCPICKMFDQMKDLKRHMSCQYRKIISNAATCPFVLLVAHNLHIWIFKNLQCFYTVMELAYAGVVLHSCRFYDVPRVLIADATAFQALAAVLDYVTHLASMSCWYRSDAGQDEFIVNFKSTRLLPCL